MLSNVNTDGPQAGWRTAMCKCIIERLISLGLFADFNRIAWYLLSIYISISIIIYL